ncbi:MAG TPA: SigE family RNA polymerase sigma factor [Streptosporangiaceae bacterium]|jgi:RNA polymerase sigma-70 factor (sigma-E family)|nr:SigE family RNA polymerase sigma factor [Streptosporangiaceae bacterium]
MTEEVTPVPDQLIDHQLERLLADRGSHLLRTAVLLAGNHQDGEDLLQAALERLLRRRRRIEGSAEAYLRRILYNLAADGWRRGGAWARKLPLVQFSQPTAVPDLADAVDLRDALIRILWQLSPQQRAVVVLRYWEQLTEAEIADVLGCTEGTVKTAAWRGLNQMRKLAAPWLPAPAGVGPALTMKEGTS